MAAPMERALPDIMLLLTSDSFPQYIKFFRGNARYPVLLLPRLHSPTACTVQHVPDYAHRRFCASSLCFVPTVPCSRTWSSSVMRPLCFFWSSSCPPSWRCIPVFVQCIHTILLGLVAINFEGFLGAVPEACMVTSQHCRAAFPCSTYQHTRRRLSPLHASSKPGSFRLLQTLQPQHIFAVKSRGAPEIIRKIAVS